jgi:chromate transporter
MKGVGILFLTFLKIGLLSIGGGYAIIPLIQEQVVTRAGWVSEKVFTDIITISQMTPGPLAVNTSTFVGLQIAGIPGAVAATVGCVSCGAVLSLLLYRFFMRHQQSVCVLEVLNGLKAASLGLIISAAATILLIAFCGTSTPGKSVSLDFWALAIFGASLLVLRKWKVNPMVLMAVTGVLGVFFYR